MGVPAESIPTRVWNWNFYGVPGGRMPVARGLHSCEQAAPHVHSCPRYFNVSAIIPVFLLRLVHLRIWGLQVQVLSGAPLSQEVPYFLFATNLTGHSFGHDSYQYARH